LKLVKLQDWIADKSGPDGWYAYVKRLSANDTGLTGGHGSGIYIPAAATEKAFPSILTHDQHNPDCYFKGQVDSHNMQIQDLRAIYYNSKFSEDKKNGRDEQRITRWKQGVDYAPLQDPENTGALAIIAFQPPEQGDDIERLLVWVCNDVEEEDYIEGMIGEVLPAVTIFKPVSELLGGIHQIPLFENNDITLPEAWSDVFPSGAEIVDFVISRYPFTELSPDKRLLKRREQEYLVFRLVEDLHALPLIQNGFVSVVDFIAIANSISNRRKSRAGRSLELHLERIFLEEGLTGFDTQAITERNKKPDFVFPGIEFYRDVQFPDDRLNMLAVKTTLKDRWRQVLNEAHRIPHKYLFTLQEGVSGNQFKEMTAEGITLVVPAMQKKKFPETMRSELMTLEEFMDHMKLVNQTD
jgi:hypothetical protein